MQDFQWWHWILAALAAVVVLRFVFSFGVTFNLTDWKKYRDKRLERALKVHCPHVEIVSMENRQVEVKCLITSPPMTHQWFCNRCGQVFLRGEVCKELQLFYGQNPLRYLAQMKKLDKISKKLYG